MKNFLYRCRASVVFILKILLYVALGAVLFGLLGIHNPWILIMSRTAAVMLLSFLASCIFLERIYGGFDIGRRKSKPIVFSYMLSVFFLDIITFAMLVIMNTNDTTQNRLYPYFAKDLGLLVAAYFIQMAVVYLFTYGAHALYFWFTPPEKCLVVTGPETDPAHFISGLAKYKKQYDIVRTISWDDPELKSVILGMDSVFLVNFPQDKLSDVIFFCYKNRKNIYRDMSIPDMVTMNSHLFMLNDITVVVSEVKAMTMGQRIAKRLMDIFISGVGLIITSPILAVCAILIKAEDGGPVFFKQNRITLRGKIFNIYKLRTMIQNADHSMVTDGDMRITRIGAFLRKFRIDEIPQFWNVLKGEMSVVGPRAEMAEYVYAYSEMLPEFLYRYRMKAGITGYAQINGKYNSSAKDKLMMDLTYIQTFSIWNDIRIIFQTVLVLLKADDSTEAFGEQANENRVAAEKAADERVHAGEAAVQDHEAIVADYTDKGAVK